MFNTPPGIDCFSSHKGNPKTGATQKDGIRNFPRPVGAELGSNLPSVNNFLSSLHHSTRDAMVNLPQNYFPVQQNTNWANNQQISNYLFLRKVFNNGGNNIQEFDPYSSNDLKFKNIANPPEKLSTFWQPRSNNTGNYFGGFFTLPGQQNPNYNQRSFRPQDLISPYQMLGKELKHSHVSRVPKESKLDLNFDSQPEAIHSTTFGLGSTKLETTPEGSLSQVQQDELSLSGLMEFEVEPSAQDLLKIDMPKSPLPEDNLSSEEMGTPSNSSEDKLFSCSECGKCFNAHYNLTRHMPVHTGKVLNIEALLKSKQTDHNESINGLKV